MANKDLLKLENEYRDELPKYKEKPKITPVEKPSILTSKVSAFLERATKQDVDKDSARRNEKKDCAEKIVEMDVYITPSDGDSDGD